MIFSEVTENEHIIERQLHDIYPLLNYDVSSVWKSVYALVLIKIGLPHNMALV